MRKLSEDDVARLDEVRRRRVRMTFEVPPGAPPLSAGEVRARLRAEGVRPSWADEPFSAAFTERLVRVHVESVDRIVGPRAGQQEHRLSNELAWEVERWTGHRLTTYVCTVAGAASDAEPANPKERQAVEDEIQHQLGGLAGARLRDRLDDGRDPDTAVAPVQRLGLGPGRGVGWTLQSLVDRGADLSATTVYSLCGSTERGEGVRRDGQGAISASMSTDAMLSQLVRQLPAERGPAKVRYCTLPIGLPPDLVADREPSGFIRSIAGYLNDDWLADPDKGLDLVLAGVDVIDRRSFPAEPDELGASTYDERGRLALPVHAFGRTRNREVRRAVDGLCKALDRAAASDVAECLHRCWPIDDVPAEVQQAVDELNTVLVAPLPTGVAHAREFWLVAGGERKHDVIWDLVRQPDDGRERHRPNVLVTDERTAKYLIGRFNGRHDPEP